MPKRQECRPDRPIRLRARRTATALVAAALAATAATVGATPAEAAVPAVAQSWSNSMFRSLTVNMTRTQLGQALVTQRATERTRTAEHAAAGAAYVVVRDRATAATTADTAAKTRVTAARQAVTAAQAALMSLQPRQKARITRARNAVAAAERTLVLRRTQARNAATDLTTAKANVKTALYTLYLANTAKTSASAAVVTTQQRIAALKSPAELAAQAAAVSRAVVTAVRPGFTTADTQLVYGTTVHKSVAFAYARMVVDAQKAGILISGGGFRTRQRQIELRKINGCPDVWTAPASSCRTPTAIPGRSLHELGLAIDITSGGRSLTSKSPAFAWLKVNAKRYGFVNLPSEPWHWSITGG